MGTNVASRFYAASCVAFLVALSQVRAFESDSESLENVVRTLKGQVSALLERRQEDFRILEESIRHSLDKNSELAAVKSELEKLRREVEAMRGGPKPTVNEQKNDHLTVQWLSTAISELRTELAEISATYNSSAELQQRQEMSSGLDLLRGDVASFRRDLEELRAEQQQTVVTLGQLKQDVESSFQNSQKAVAIAAGTKAQMEGAKTEMNSFMKSLSKLTRDVKLLKVTGSKQEEEEEESNNAIHHNRINLNTPVENKKFRHHRLLRQQISDLEHSGRELQASQVRIDRSVRRLEKQLKSLKSETGNESTDERLVERVGRLEEAGRNAGKQMFNISRRVAELDRFHLSMLQLLETVESLEDKVDRSVPELQREISKMEFNMAQATSTVSLLKEDQENQRSSLKALRDSIEHLEERTDIDHGHLGSLQAQLFNVTHRGRSNESVEIHRENVQDSRIAALEEKLEIHLENNEPATTTDIEDKDSVNRSALPELIQSLRNIQVEYQNVVHQLPHDCGAIDGPSGIYAIAPGEGPPLLVSCDMTSAPGGWTIVQRRIDGSQEFNRKWKEYADGFGTPSGEFWLGNEALHRLTSENCSSLRIDITDIYGKKWVAKYEEVYIGDSSDGYRIQVSGYGGNASDALEYQNKMQFSAVDSDRDISNTHCAQNYEGGWWFSHCQHANLNGRYNLGLTWFDGTRNEWIAVSFSEMKIRRRRNCVT